MTSSEKESLYTQLPARICAWYAENKRDLPWRKGRNPYRTWVSEIMLQQTRVEAVIPYYERFLKELPDIETLAACPEEKLLKLWEGLGYYSRVRNMQKAAVQLVDEALAAPDTKASLPQDPKELQKLPGIGSYTAGAIASIAYGVRVPAVDGNVLRILARVTADDRDVLKDSVRREAEELLTKALQNTAVQKLKPGEFRQNSRLESGECGQNQDLGSGESGQNRDPDPGEFNQGMMDLDAGICLPNTTPLCEKCPLTDLCEAHQTGQETAFPVRKKAKERRVEQRTILLIRDGERVALTQRPHTGLLAGMYEFPNLAGKQSRRSVLQTVEEQNLEPLHIRKLEPARHLFSHIEWQMTGYEIRVAGFPDPEAMKTGSGRWILVEIGQIEREYPIPSAYKAYAEHLQMNLGARKRK